MKLDKLLEQMQRQWAQKNVANGGDHQNVVKQEDEMVDKTVENHNIDAKGGGEKSSPCNSPQVGSKPSFPSSLLVNNNNGNGEEKDVKKQQEGGGSESRMASNETNNHPQQQLNIISAFLKANPLPNFPLPSSSIPDARPITIDGTKANGNGNSPLNLSSSPSTTTNSSSSSSQTSSSTLAVVPLSRDVASQGLFAVGGCRQCSKTFTDRLALIHHFVDHFPNIFYSFEERLSSQQQSTKPNPETATNDSKVGTNGQAITAAYRDPSALGNAGPSAELLGQLASFFALVNGASSNNLPPPPLKQTPEQQPFGANFINSLLLNRPTNGRPHQFAHQFAHMNGAHLKKGMPTTGAGGKLTTAKKRQQQQMIDGQNGGADGHQPKRASNGGGGSENKGKVPMPSPTLSELPYHMCPHCCLTFAETTAFKAHLAMHEAELNSAGPPLVGGPFPGAGFASADESQRQQPAMKCPLCDMKFTNAFRLNEHMRLHSAHSCEICQKTFMTAFDLNLHMGTHTGFTYDCKDCGKCFPCRKTLAEHNRSHRMILSNGGGGGNGSPEQGMANLGGNENNGIKMEIGGQVQMDLLDNSMFAGLFGQQQFVADQNGRDRRKMRAPRKGEKSRRNATLVALESTSPPTVNSSGVITPPAPVQFWPSIKSEEGGGSAAAESANAVGGCFPLMEEFLLRALMPHALAEQQRQKNGGEEEGTKEKAQANQ